MTLKKTSQDVEKQREVITPLALLGKTPTQTENPRGHKKHVEKFRLYVYLLKDK